MNATLSCPGAGRQAAGDEARRLLAGFRGEFYRCLTGRPDALFEAADAVLCEDRPVTDLARLSLVPEFTRGHGALYDGLNEGRVEFARLRVTLAGLPLPGWADGRIRLAVDVCNWLRPDAGTSPERLFCHVHGRGRNAGQVVPGWPYSFVAALGPGRSSWALPLDAVRLGPDDDECEVTAAQLREVVARLAAAGRWREGDPPVIIVMDCRVQRDAAGLAAPGPAGDAGRAGALGPRVVLPAAGPPAGRPRAQCQARGAGPVR